VLVGLSDLGSREYGLSYARGRAVAALHDSGPMVMSALSRALGVTPRTVTGLVDALEADGWVTRSPHPTDRRATVIQVTPRAAETFARLEEVYRVFAGQLMGDIAESDLERVLAVIEQIRSRFGKAGLTTHDKLNPTPGQRRELTEILGLA
jgi:DNA-binding MarR family transcriptional regulator